ncbi:ricin-type beta-trefoil lectin domain protein [Streptomyces sp. NPDC058274]|uniref:ricin-type beta-trefoil lectin domain protein n=1 Tax=Streptomyces sp. NPDC058274 TaxID=3346416 RepID=UPI0036ED5B86
MHTAASDARLTELLRADTSTAYPALRELRVRHRSAVLAHARLYTVDEPAARQLTAQAFALAARDAARGIDPRGPWRHQLLLLTGRAAVSWAADERATRLDPGLCARLRESGHPGPTGLRRFGAAADPAGFDDLDDLDDLDGPPGFGPPQRALLPAAAHHAGDPFGSYGIDGSGGPDVLVPPMLDAFHALPARVQGLVWYAVVDEEPDDRTAGFLGFTRADVTYGKEPALQALRHSCLKTRLARSGDPRCQDFRRLIEQAVRPESPRRSADLDAHMARCAHCGEAYEEQAALRSTPRTALAEGLLPWAGAAYVMDARAGRRSAAGAVAGWARWPSRRYALASAALGVALAPLLAYLLFSGGPEPARTASAVSTPLPLPAVTVTATVSTTPSPEHTAKSPKPTRTSTPSKTARPTPPKPKPKPKPKPTRTPPHPPNGTYAQVVNVDSGLCLDIRDGVLDLGTDVITVRCTSSRTQRWRVDTRRGVLQSAADPDYCLDSRGSTDRGVGIWECQAVYSSNGRNLMFQVDDRGLIRPAIAPDHAVTPYGDSLFLTQAWDRDNQRWQAGRA